MNVSLSTKERDIEVKYGMFDFGDERENARASLKYILTDLTDIKNSYIRLGFHLIEFNRMQYYKDFGYPTFAEFCIENIPLDKSAISRCMAVCENFCIKDTPFSQPKMFIDERYKEYNYSQLCEMISMKDDDRRKVNPQMSVKQIRELKKRDKDVYASLCNAIHNVPQVATSQPDKVFLCANDLVMKKGIVLQNHIKKCASVGALQLFLYDSNGKVVYSGNCDILLSGSIGEQKKITCRITDSE